MSFNRSVVICYVFSNKRSDKKRCQAVGTNDKAIYRYCSTFFFSLRNILIKTLSLIQKHVAGILTILGKNGGKRQIAKEDVRVAKERTVRRSHCLGVIFFFSSLSTSPKRLYFFFLSPPPQPPPPLSDDAVDKHLSFFKASSLMLNSSPLGVIRVDSIFSVVFCSWTCRSTGDVSAIETALFFCSVSG